MALDIRNLSVLVAAVAAVFGVAAVRSADTDGRSAPAPMMVDVIDGTAYVHAAPDVGAPPPPAGGADPVCVGDGRSGPRVQLTIAADARAVGELTAGELDAKAARVRSVARQIDKLIFDSAAKTGGVRHVRWVHDADCAPTISWAAITETSGQGTLVRTEVQDVVGTGRDRLHLVFLDASVSYDGGHCGRADADGDETKGLSNRSAYGERFAYMAPGCWSASTAGHELVHLLGSVNRGAPNQTPGMHCSDEYDLMCYADGSGVPMRSVCDDDHAVLLDCNNDDYFHTDPPPGSYLAEHWNTADSPFLRDPHRTVDRREVGGRTADDVTLGLFEQYTAGRGLPGGTVVVVGEDAAVDAMAASFLAGHHVAPVVVAGDDGLSARAVSAIDAAGARTAVLVGGSTAVPEVVRTQLRGIGVTGIVRRAGVDRFRTAAELVNRVWFDEVGSLAEQGRAAIVVNGSAFADAAIVGPLAFRTHLPVLLTHADRVPQVSLDALANKHVQFVYVVGGTAVVSDAVVDQLAAAGITVERVAGADRETTSVAFADLLQERHGFTTTAPVVVSGTGVEVFAAASVAGASPPSPLLVRVAHDGPAAAWLDAHDPLQVTEVASRR